MLPSLLLSILCLIMECILSSWHELDFVVLSDGGWVSSDLKFTNNFLIPMRRDPNLVIVGNRKRGSPAGEGCIRVYSLRNRSKPSQDLAGDCSSETGDGSESYNDGRGTDAHMMSPEQGYQTQDGVWTLFVDNKSCARKLNMINKDVTTVIGSDTCGEGTLDMEAVYGAETKVIGMAFLEVKELWIFFVPDGIYIYSFDGARNRRVMERSRMSEFPSDGSDTGTLSNSPHSNDTVFQKVQYGVNQYNFSKIYMDDDDAAQLEASGGEKTTITKLYRSLNDTDIEAEIQHNNSDPRGNLSSSDGHVAQHPVYPELLLVSDREYQHIVLLNTDSKTVRQYCKRAADLPGDKKTFTSTSKNHCGFTSLTNLMWVGGEKLAAIAAVQDSTRIFELRLRYGDYDCRNSHVCWKNGICYDIRPQRKTECLCKEGWIGDNCEIEICTERRCNGRGTCEQRGSTFFCRCTENWKGRNCQISKHVRLTFKSIDYHPIGSSEDEKTSITTDTTFFSRKDKNILITGVACYSKEGALGYYRTGHWNQYNNIAGTNCHNQTANSHDDGVGVEAHMRYPRCGYLTLDSKYFLFLDLHTCARSLEISSGTVKTIIGIGRCGNGTLDLAEYGTSQRVDGMTYLERKSPSLWIFSIIEDGIYMYSSTGKSRRRIASVTQLSYYGGFPSMMTLGHGHLVYVYVAYGITILDFEDVQLHNGKNPAVSRLATLKKKNSEVLPLDFDKEATLNYDDNDPDIHFAFARGQISVNLKYPTLWLVTSHHMNLLLMDVLDGSAYKICQIGSEEKVGMNETRQTCQYIVVASTFWIDASTAWLVDTFKNTYELKFQEGPDDACSSSPCVNGSCYDLAHGYGCLCNDGWSNKNCDKYLPRCDEAEYFAGVDKSIERMTTEPVARAQISDSSVIQHSKEMLVSVNLLIMTLSITEQFYLD